MRSLTLVFVALFALSGCPSGDLSNTCHFEGESTACGRCIASYCQRFIDRECAAFISNEVALAQLDACGSGRGCGLLFENGSDIGACAKSLCPNFCSAKSAVPGAEDAGAATDPNITCTKTDEACSCTGKTTSIVPSAACTGDFCCASTTSWKTSTSGSCSCAPVGCLEDDSNLSDAFCVCGPYQARGKATPVASCHSDFLCCRSDTQCKCYAGSGSCPSGESQEHDCSVSDLRLDCGSRIAVSSCK